MTDYGQAMPLMTKGKDDAPRPVAGFNMDAMYEVAMDYGARNYGGKISLSKWNGIV